MGRHNITCTRTHTYTNVRTPTRTHARTNARTHIHTHANTRTHARTHARTHTHTIKHGGLQTSTEPMINKLDTSTLFVIRVGARAPRHSPVRRQHDGYALFSALRNGLPCPTARHQVHAGRRFIEQDVLCPAYHGHGRVQVPPVTTAGHDNDGQFNNRPNIGFYLIAHRPTLEKQTNVLYNKNMHK